MWNGQLKTWGWHSTDPLYNILDPLVQDRVRRLVAEHVELLKDQPGFKGIVFHATRHCLLSLGSLDSGYNDGNLRQFEKDTGKRIPVDRHDPRRTFLSYRWLMDHAREEWIVVAMREDPRLLRPVGQADHRRPAGCLPGGQTVHH